MHLRFVTLWCCGAKRASLHYTGCRHLNGHHVHCLQAWYNMWRHRDRLALLYSAFILPYWWMVIIALHLLSCHDNQCCHGTYNCVKKRFFLDYFIFFVTNWQVVWCSPLGKIDLKWRFNVFYFLYFHYHFFSFSFLPGRQKKYKEELSNERRLLLFLTV